MLLFHRFGSRIAAQNGVATRKSIVYRTYVTHYWEGATQCVLNVTWLINSVP